MIAAAAVVAPVGPTGILSALPEEQHGLAAMLQDASPAESRAGRRFVRGHLGGRPVVLALSGIGKVAAAATTVVLAECFGIDRLLFTGVAGGLAPGVRVGDLVVADGFLQHDMDASPLFPRYEVPSYGRARFDADPAFADGLREAAGTMLADLPGVCGVADIARFGLADARVHRGLLVSGDRFVCTAAETAGLRARLPEALAVDMESAAVAQVCHDYRLPFAAVRTVSDRADDSAPVDFPAFVEAVAGRYARATVAALFGLDRTGRAAPAAAISASPGGGNRTSAPLRWPPSG